MKRFAFALALILAAFTFAAPTAHAQSVGFHFSRGGIHIDIGGHHHGSRYSPGCNSYDRYNSGSYYGHSRSYNSQPSAIRVLVNREVVVYDRVYDRRCGRTINVPRRTYQRVYVIAYWDSSRGGYWYRDAYGRYCRAG